MISVLRGVLRRIRSSPLRSSISHGGKNGLRMKLDQKPWANGAAGIGEC